MQCLSQLLDVSGQRDNFYIQYDHTSIAPRTEQIFCGDILYTIYHNYFTFRGSDTHITFYVSDINKL